MKDSDVYGDLCDSYRAIDLQLRSGWEGRGVLETLKDYNLGGGNHVIARLRAGSESQGGRQWQTTLLFDWLV